MLLLNTLVILAVVAVSSGFWLQENSVSSDGPTYIKYYLYNDAAKGVAYESNAEAVPEFNATAETVVLIHSHEGNYQDNFASSVRQAYTDRHGVNVIVMEWAYLASGKYSNAVKNVPRAAADLVQFLEVLRGLKGASAEGDGTEGEGGAGNENEAGGNDDGAGGEAGAGEAAAPATNEDVHLIGFGLGAHLAGNAGSQLRVTAPIARITGLDPTSKDYGANSLRLSSTSAVYVEVIHTDGGLLGMGTSDTIGDVDFFVNGGEKQPGCLFAPCAHNRAYEVFASSLQFDQNGRRCTSMWEVSFNSCKGVALKLGGSELVKGAYPGIYRVNTGSSYPYV